MEGRHEKTIRNRGVSPYLVLLLKALGLAVSFHRSTHLAMYTLFSLCISFLFIVSINATALMTQISANEKLCFYTEVDKAGEKIGVCNMSVSNFIFTD